ncbi:MAG TPA: LuxR C-terminal-related transcriptional regulator [Bacillota bacterium]|nr:LuxR C-terminal-related transcriptional regulator [Bacillota bacterium]
MLPVFSAYETKLKLLDGDSSAAKEWLENYFITESYNPELHRIFLHFTTVRAYIVLEEYEKAELLCEKLWKLCTDYHRLIDAAEAAVLLTVILRLTDRETQASALLQKTLLDMEPYCYIRVFADEGNAILPVLKKLIKKADMGNGTVMPGSPYMKTVYMSVYEQSKRYKGIGTSMGRKQVKLSAQQKHMIELLAKGYKNAEVVELTGLSINTIRYHTKLAYQKLGVNNAKDAVLRAKELSII